jgi:hypothetical protein
VDRSEDKRQSIMMFGKIGKGNEDEEDLQNEQQKARQRAARD